MGAAASINALSPEELGQGIAGLGKAYVSYNQAVVDEAISGKVLFQSVQEDENLFRAFLVENLGVQKPLHQTVMYNRYVEVLVAGEGGDKDTGPKMPIFDVRDAVERSPKEILNELFQIQGIPLDPDNVAASVDKIAAALIASVGEDTGCDGKSLFHGFISYRVAADKDIAEKVYDKLSMKGLFPFLDKYKLLDGQPWKAGFLQGLTGSRCFISLISRKALESCRDKTQNHEHDNVLLEIETALRYKRETGNNAYIIPVLVGEIVKIDGADALRKFADFAGSLYADTVKGNGQVSAPVVTIDPAVAAINAATAEIAAMKAKAEQEAKEIKAKAEREAKEQADRVNATSSEIAAMKAKAEQEAKEIKAKAEREAKAQADRNAASSSEVAAMKAKAEREIAELKAKAERERMQQSSITGVSDAVAARLTCPKRHKLALVTRASGYTCDVCKKHVTTNGSKSNLCCLGCDYDVCEECASVTGRSIGTTGLYYCGRRLGTTAIPGSDGQCGPTNGPQCKGCQAYFPNQHLLEKATVHIIGATGANSDSVNGEYKATTELSGGMPIYAKLGSTVMILEYLDVAKAWQAKNKTDKGLNRALAYCNTPVKCLPQDCPVSKWEVTDNTKFHKQPAVTISSHIFIIGATGANGDSVNGEYKATTELSCEMPIYAKVGSTVMILEYLDVAKAWQAKNKTDKGLNRALAYCKVPAKCLPQDCPVSKWEVTDNTNFHPQPAVTISVV